MTLTPIDPKDLPTPETYSHVIVATGGKAVFIAGQVSENEMGEIVGAGDMIAQSNQAFANLGRALAAAGARPDQVAKLGIFVVNYKREHLAMIEFGRKSLFGEFKPADTLVGVAALSHPDYMIEVDAIAILDEK